MTTILKPRPDRTIQFGEETPAKISTRLEAARASCLKWSAYMGAEPDVNPFTTVALPEGGFL